MRTISIINQKGGCGKTTTAINLSASLAKLNRRVLLIDLDPQGHASLGLNLKPEDLTKGMTEVLTQATCLDDVIYESICPNLDLAPANITLSSAEPLLASVSQKEQRLLSAIEALRRSYHYIIIDSPPSLGMLTFNALRASDEAIVPVDMSFFSLHGLAKLIEIVDVVARHTGHDVAVWALATMVNSRMRFAQEILGEVQRHFMDRTFKTMIRNNVRLREAASHGLPITEFDPHAKGAVDYMALAQEVVLQEAAVPIGAIAEKAVPGIPEIEAQKFLGPILIEEILPDPSKRSVL
ncbi:MAG: ParA family protein [Candidatus Melainabacteria bacterium]|nr:ParA family protein [Candidatus Melainabacteria bacterium]